MEESGWCCGGQGGATGLCQSCTDPQVGALVVVVVVAAAAVVDAGGEGKERGSSPRRAKRRVWEGPRLTERCAGSGKACGGRKLPAAATHTDTTYTHTYIHIQGTTNKATSRAWMRDSRGVSRRLGRVRKPCGQVRNRQDAHGKTGVLPFVQDQKPGPDQAGIGTTVPFHRFPDHGHLLLLACLGQDVLHEPPGEIRPMLRCEDAPKQEPRQNLQPRKSLVRRLLVKEPLGKTITHPQLELPPRIDKPRRGRVTPIMQFTHILRHLIRVQQIVQRACHQCLVGSHRLLFLQHAPRAALFGGAQGGHDAEHRVAGAAGDFDAVEVAVEVPGAAVVCVGVGVCVWME